MNPATMRDWGWEPSTAGFAQMGARERFTRTVGFFERTLLPALHRAGVGILAGTDAPIPAIIPGFSLVDELRAFVRAGLTPFEALASATRAPAEFLGASGEWGTIAVGRSADLVLLDRNPLEDIEAVARPAGVMVRGRWLPRAELNRMLDEIAGGYRH
jgi:imidazolonepropionase-like amidohydrolase